MLHGVNIYDDLLNLIDIFVLRLADLRASFGGKSNSDNFSFSEVLEVVCVAVLLTSASLEFLILLTADPQRVCISIFFISMKFRRVGEKWSPLKSPDAGEWLNTRGR